MAFGFSSFEASGLLFDRARLAAVRDEIVDGKMEALAMRDPALRKILVEALYRGLDLDDHEPLLAALRGEIALPDKLSNAARASFAIAGQLRDIHGVKPPACFAGGQQEIYLPLVDLGTVEERLRLFLQNWNIRAALWRVHGPSPEVLERYGKLALTSLRQNPEMPKRLQMINPSTGTWCSAGKIAGFLKNAGAWALEEDWQTSPLREGNVQEEVQASLKDLTHRRHVLEKPFDPASLMVVISRDPQKIGEMATGQRWSTCFTEGNSRGFFGKTENEIQHGSLVAYLTAREDVDVRYPLLRTLLKPHFNEEGACALIPSTMYGCAWRGLNFRQVKLYQLFSDTVVSFADEMNAGKKGIFRCSDNVHPDGQFPVAFLGVNDAKQIEAAMESYRPAKKAWCEEKENKLLERIDEFWLEPPKRFDWKIAQMRKHAASMDNPEKLARRFFRDVRKYNLHHLPDPFLLKAAAHKIITAGAAKPRRLANG